MIQVHGLAGVLAGFAAAKTGIEAASEVGLAEAAGRVQVAWINNIIGDDLVLTGHYRDSVKVNEEGPAAVTTDAPYARFLEFGTSRQAPHYPATRAADENHAAVLDAVQGHVREAL